jgi:hypothetical protein
MGCQSPSEISIFDCESIGRYLRTGSSSARPRIKFPGNLDFHGAPIIVVRQRGGKRQEIETRLDAFGTEGGGDGKQAPCVAAHACHKLFLIVVGHGKEGKSWSLVHCIY